MKVMEKFIIAAWLCCCLSITAGEDGQDAGNVEIENCNEGFIDIQENANNTIQCKGFNGSDIIGWAFIRNDKNMSNGVATCDASSHCTVNQPDHFAVERSASHSTLFYQQYDREVDKGATVTCASVDPSSNESMTCSLNVINQAKLSSCTVNEDRDSRIVTGRCRFDHAYSYRRGFQCSWYQEKDGMSTSFSGNITYESGLQSPTGWCTFTTWEPGNYTYSIDFYPGPGNITVNVGNIATSSPDVSLQTTKDSVDYTNRQTPTLGTTPATRSPDVSPPTTNVHTTSSPDVSLLTTKDSVDYTSPKTQEENDLPLGAIVGGIVAGVAAVIVVVVVVVVFVRRKRKQKAAGSAHGSGNVTATENDDFAEHLNPMYVTSEDLDDTDITDHKPSATTVRSSPNTHNGHTAAPPSLEADMYTTVDGEASHAPSSAADMFGGYGDIGIGRNGSKRVPQKDEYAVVDKPREQKGPASSANTRASSPAHTTESSDEYAVVDKSSSRNKTAKSVASDLPDDTANKAGADVYAQVNKPAKKVKVAEPETEGAAYAQVQKPKPAVKPKISAKPSSKTDVTQRDAEDDDEYHTLSHTRVSPHTQDQADLQ